MLRLECLAPDDQRLPGSPGDMGRLSQMLLLSPNRRVTVHVRIAALVDLRGLAAPAGPCPFRQSAVTNGKDFFHMLIMFSKRIGVNFHERAVALGSPCEDTVS